MRIPLLALGLLLSAAIQAPAQQTRTISPGMTRAEVVGVFGSPAIVRQTEEWTYLFYRNGCLPRCGSDDVVFLKQDRVVAAVLRSPSRRFAGPDASSALEAATEKPAGGTEGVVRGIRVDTKPEQP